MASTYSPNLRLELIGTGEQQGTWGSTTNTNLGTLLEEAIGGYVSAAVTDGADTTLTTVNGGADQSRNMTINLTGALSATRNVICPAIEKLYVVKNATTGGFDVTFKVSGQTGVSVPNGATVFLYVDGTDARTITGSLASQTASNVSITGGSITGTSISSSNVAITGGSISNVTGVVLNPASVVQGDILYYSGSAWARLAAGTSGQYLKTNGANANPQWAGVTGEYYSQNTTPSNASNTAVWYSGLDDMLYMYANSEWWVIGNGGIGPNINRVLNGGGWTLQSNYSTIELIDISTTGNASIFGSLSVARSGIGTASNGQRAVFGSGGTGNDNVVQLLTNVIDYVTIAVNSNAVDFGDSSFSRAAQSGCSNGTRGIFGGGNQAGTVSNVIDYITIATISNAADFGDLSVARAFSAAASNGTRGCFAGGGTATMPYNGGTQYNVVDYVTIATTGNATDFGDLTLARSGVSSVYSTTRGCFSGGANASSSAVNVIDYITIATTGNATDFGDLLSSAYGTSGSSNGTRGLIMYGTTTLASNTIEYITIATTGNSTDFGDLVLKRSYAAGVSGFYGV